MHHRSMLGFVLIALALSCGHGAAASFNLDTTPGKLPKEVVPLAYRIELMPDLSQIAVATGEENIGFSGRVQIDIEVRRPVAAITLNAADITFAHATIDGVASTVEIDRRNQTAKIVSPQMLAAGPHTLIIEYSGTILPRPEALFYSTYDTPAGRRWALATDLQPSGARRIFPGWDEPAFKATFTLSVVVPATLLALSNMPVVHEQADGAGRKIVTFATTPRMSSYLFVLMVGEFDRIATSAEGVGIGVVLPRHQIAQGRYAFGVAPRVMTYLSDYFGVKFPLPKLDNILVPGNFSGAMENWGAITYSERALLFDPATASQLDREVVHQYVVHELAHQWFGNLVTMAWWDDLWLNEGFASWMEKKVTDEFNPSWKIWVRARADKEKAMAKDALRTSHPVQQTIEDESEASAAFDDITYLKGLSFVRMLEAYVGAAPFREGLRRYMAKHAYSNATSADLWAALEAASNKPIAAIAAGFTRQAGLPLIQVSTRCVDNKLTVRLSQGRYVLNDPYAAHQVWQVPVALGRPGDEKASDTVLVDGTPRTATFEDCDRPVKANYGDVGYYRVYYDEDALKALAATYRQLPAADRVSFMADAWAMVMAGRTSPAAYLDLTRSLPDESELAVWDNVIESLRFIDDQHTGSPLREGFRAYARELLRPALKRLGWEPRPDEEAESGTLRHRLIATLGSLGDPEVTAEARRRFAVLVRDRASVPAALREAIAKAVAYAADRQIYADLLRLARESESEQERILYYDALAGARNADLIEQTAQIARTDAQLPPAHTARFLEQAAKESGDPDLVWRLTFVHRHEFLDRLGGLERQEALPRIARASSNPAVAFELRWADVTRANRGMRRFADEAGEEIELKADLKMTLVPAVGRWITAWRNR